MFYWLNSSLMCRIGDQRENGYDWGRSWIIPAAKRIKSKHIWNIHFGENMNIIHENINTFSQLTMLSWSWQCRSIANWNSNVMRGCKVVGSKAAFLIELIVQCCEVHFHRPGWYSKSTSLFASCRRNFFWGTKLVKLVEFVENRHDIIASSTAHLWKVVSSQSIRNFITFFVAEKEVKSNRWSHVLFQI